MKLLDLARDHLKRAEVRVRSARMAYSGKYYPDVIRFSQEAVEMSLKASLRSVGIEYPKEHDVGRLLKREREKLPDWFSSETDALVEISAELAQERAASLYGLEAGGKRPGELFGEREAKKALADSERVFSLAKRLLSGPTKKTRV